MGKNHIIKKGFVVGTICLFLLMSIPLVSSSEIPVVEEKVNTNGEGRYYIFEDSSGQREIKYIENNAKKGNNLPKKIITNTNDNLAPNPSFEEGDVMPTGWTYSPDTNGTYTWDSNYAYSGEKSIGVLNLTNASSYGDICWVTTDFIPVDSMSSYNYSGWLKFVGIPPKYQYAYFFIQEYNINYQYRGGGGYLYGFTSEWSYMYDNAYFNDYNTKYVKIELGQATFHENEHLNPLVEVRFDDIYFSLLNTHPNTPTITGETNGKARTLYDYTFTTIDPDQDNVTYVIDWGDNTTQTTDFYESGEEVIISHIWGLERTYNVRVKAIDDSSYFGLESDWATLTVTMPCSYNMQLTQFLELLFQRFSYAFPILQQLLGY